ncbi:MAG: hypothetical protein LBT05_12440 [Planctomycetaceae bacterium]|nr:hypothetical protein [Planctomycetaceae bacterium]
MKLGVANPPIISNSVGVTLEPFMGNSYRVSFLLARFGVRRGSRAAAELCVTGGETARKRRARNNQAPHGAK